MFNVEVMENIDKIVSTNLIVRMKDLKTDQKTLAVCAQITPQHLNKLLKGKKSISKSNALKGLAQCLNCDEAELYQMIASLKEAHSRTKDLNRTLGEQLGETLIELKQLASEFKSADMEIARLKKENERLIRTLKGLPAKMATLWEPAGTGIQALCMYLITEEKEYLHRIPKAQRAKAAKLFQVLAVELLKAPS